MASALPSEFFPRDIAFHLENVSRSGGVATNGQERVVASDAGRWKARLIQCPVMTDDQILAFRGWLFGMQGRAGTCLVPVFGEERRANWPRDELGRVVSPETARRNRLDGTQFADPAEPAQTQISARLRTAAPRRATTLQIELLQGSPIRPGQYFSFNGRLHVITAALGGEAYAIRPPLREAAGQGWFLNLSAPVCEMRLASDDSGELELQLGRWGFVDLEFVEAF